MEADLGGAFFDATVTRVAGNKYDVQFVDTSGNPDFEDISALTIDLSDGTFVFEDLIIEYTTE